MAPCDRKLFFGVLIVIVGTCIGVPAAPRAIACPTPSCITYDEINTLWVAPEPDTFWQCRPHDDGTWYLQLMPCAPATLFSFRHQVCVHESMWEACDGSGGGEPTIPTTTTEEPTTTTTTTEEPTFAPSTPDSELGCGPPRCVTYEEINTLWEHPSSDHFYQCRPMDGAWVPQEMPCAPTTLFSFRHQVCVFAAMWEGFCSTALL